MRLWPVLLDSRPPYLGARQLTLLSAPLGDQTVFSYVGSGLEVLTTQQTLVVSPPGGDSQAYREQTAFASAYPIAVCAPEHFNAHLGAYELSDALLILDLRWVPADLCELGALLRQHRSDPRVVQHLVENEHLRHAAGEHVRFDEIGQVRAIQRHYRRATWSHIAAVSASIVPVACAVLAERREHFNLTTLLELRRAMSAAGLANRDLFHRGGVFHLGDEPGLLAANERTVLRARERGIDSRSARSQVHQSARIIGPVVIQSTATVGPNAVLIGPSVIGSGAHVGDGTVISHSVIGAGSTVPAGAAVHGRAWFDGTSGGSANDFPPPLPHFYSDTTDRGAFDFQDRQRAALRDAQEPSFTAKRAIDTVCSLLGLLVLSPLLLAIALLISLQGDGPVLYGDEREGLGGRVFQCWKFRTMSTGANSAQQELQQFDQVDGPHFKAARDPRVTPVGRLLRTSNLDELPQLWNVLVGDMSFVGPRPSPFRENQICVPWSEARVSVRPGITGLWQICRHDRSVGDFHQWIEYDVLYVQHASLWLDFKILAATAVTLGGKLTYFRPETLLGTRAFTPAPPHRTAA